MVWRSEQLPDTWLYTDGRIFRDPKVVPDNFTPECKGKGVLSVLAKRLTSNWTHQWKKGGVSGNSGCIEHTSVRTQLIKEARATTGDLIALWLDLANAYGTVPHKLVDHKLKEYRVPEKFQKLLTNYYDHFKMRIKVSDYTASRRCNVTATARGRDSYRMYHLCHSPLRSNELDGQDSREHEPKPVTISGI